MLTKLKASLGLTAGFLCYLGPFFTLAIVLYGGIISKTILVILLAYQYIFLTNWDSYRKFINWLGPYNFFKENGLILEEEISENMNMFCFHPHGILVMSLPFSCLRHPILYKAKMLASRAICYTPLSGIFLKWLGGYEVSPNKFKEYLTNGDNICFSPGGFEEATISDHRKDRVFVRSRKGFIKYALEFGYKLYPCYTFNENKAYYTYNGLEKFRLWVNKFKFPAAIFMGKYWIFPRDDLKFYTVMGKGIQCPKIDHPTNEQIDEFHQKYIEELKRIFYTYKEKYGGSEQLEVL